MLHPPVTISIAFVHGMLSGMQAQGKLLTPFLADAGIAPELLQQPDARVTAEQYIALFRSLTERCSDDLFGFLSRPLSRGSLALIIRSAMSADSLQRAMSRAAHTFRLLQDDVVLEPVREGELAGWALRFTDVASQQPVFLHELLLRVAWRMLAWLTGGKLPVVRFDFAFKRPLHVEGYGKIFPGSQYFERPQSAFWFDAARLEHPVRRDEVALRAFLTHAEANFVVPRRDDGVVSANVRRHLHETLPAWPDLAATADALHMSLATLQRHLAKDGTTFQSLKDELRRDMAIVRLSTGNAALAELADELGFSDSTAFQRAFKGWTGSAPGAYRRGQT